MACLISSLPEISAYQGLPVSKETAQKTFCALGDGWWKQVFDGKCHVYGKMVFDEGLHGREKEPGFYASAEKAFHFAKDNIGAELTVKLYCQVHEMACSHFQGRANNTEMDASEAGSFRNESHSGTKCRFPVEDVIAFFDQADLKGDSRLSLIREFQVIRKYSGSKTLELCLESYLQGQREYFNLPSLTASHMLEFETLLQKKMGETAADLLKLKNDPQLGKAYPTIALLDSLLDIGYARSDLGNIEEAVSHVFSEFNRSMATIDTQILQMGLDDSRLESLTDQKLILIADLYQKLEWFHPFLDGQGRTDLIALGMLLSKYGFCPAILDDPYVSSFAPLADWVAYLKEGMAKWKELAKVSAVSESCLA